MSATMAQFIFKDNWPKNISMYVDMVFWETIIMAPVIRGTLNINPNAQINGSAVGNRLTILVDKMEPKGTPMIPANIVMAPNLNETLFLYQQTNKNRKSS